MSKDGDELVKTGSTDFLLKILDGIQGFYQTPEIE